MCRFMIYKGAKSMLMADLLTNPARSIVTQSYASRERIQCNPLNGDGFGVGWYTDPKQDKISKKDDPTVPCVFTSITPAWNNINLKRLSTKIHSPLIFAHVRAAYPGMLVSEANCHPFQLGRFLWMHNGGIGKFSSVARVLRESLRDDLYNAMQGSTDSEMAFMLFLNQLPDPFASYTPEKLKEAIEEVAKRLGTNAQEVSLLNFAVTDGCTVLATKWVSWPNHEPASLYFSSGTKFECDAQGEYRMHREERTEQAAIITSEPLTEDPKDWVPVPRNHLIMITPDMTITLHPIETLPPLPTMPLVSSYPNNKRRSEAAVDTNGFNLKKSASVPTELSELAATHQLSHTLTSTAKVLTLELSADESKLFTGGQDGDITIWRLDTYQCVRTLKGHTGSVLSLLVSGDRLLFSSSSDSTIRLWDIETGECRATISDTISSIFALASVQNRLLFYGRQDCQVRAVDLTPLAAVPQQKITLTGHKGYVFSLAMVKNTLYSASGDGTIIAWDTTTLSKVGALEGHRSTVYVVAVWDNELYSGSKDTTIKVWDTETRHCVRTLGGHTADVIALSTSQNFLYSSSVDCTVRVWDRRRLACVQTLGDSVVPRPVALRAGSDFIAVAKGQAVQLWKSVVQPAAAKGEPAAAINSPLMEVLSAFVAIRTVSGNPSLRGECYRGAKFLHSLLVELGAETRIVQNKNPQLNPVVFGRLGHNTSLPTIVFYGHYDVVPANEPSWSSDPFVMTGRDGYVYGRGVADNKGPIVATIQAVKELLADPHDRLPCNVVFVYEGEEECHSDGFAVALAENHAWFAGTEAIVITNTCWIGENIPCLIYGLRGLIEVEVEVCGPDRDLHNGTEGGVVYEPYNELVALLSKVVDGSGRVLIPGFYDSVAPESSKEAEYIRAMHKDEFSLEAYCAALQAPRLKGNDVASVLTQRWRQPNLSISAIEGSGTSSRVISHRATAKLSIRHVPNQEGEVIISSLESWLRSNFASFQSCNVLNIKAIQSGDWWLSDPQSHVCCAAARAIEGEWGKKPLFVREGGSIPLTPYLEQTLHAPVVHIPLSQASHRAHLENERIRVENLTRAKGVIQGFIREFCREQPDVRA